MMYNAHMLLPTYSAAFWPQRSLPALFCNDLDGNGGSDVELWYPHTFDLKAVEAKFCVEICSSFIGYRPTRRLTCTS